MASLGLLMMTSLGAQVEDAMMLDALTLGAAVVAAARDVGRPGVAGGVRGWEVAVEVGDLGRLVRALKRSYFLKT